MTDPVSTALEQHALALRKLARALVGGDADDVVQATAVAALVHPHPVREPVAFLRHVLRVQAYRHHRGEVRRKHREHTHARDRGVAAPPAEHALEQREAVAALHAALMSVPQPHLGALLLRYFEDLPPQTIAERLAVPLPTIKSRLARGLELLRAELDRRTKGGDWRERFALAFALPPAVVRTGAAVSLLAILTMKLIVAVLFVGVAATLWLAWPKGDVSPPATGVVAATDSPPARAAEAAMPEPPPPPASRTAVADAPVATARLLGRVTTREATALAGAKIAVLPGFDAAATATAATDATGEFTCDVPPGEQFVVITAPRHVGVYGDKRGFAAGTTVDLGTIALDRGVVVRGRVVDRDGNVVTDTPVATSSNQQSNLPKGWWWRRRPARTDQDGRFELDPLLPFEHRVRLPQEQLLEPVTLQLAPGQADVELALRVESASRQLTMRGRVVDEGDRGIAGATVTATERVDLEERKFAATSGGDGTFSIRRLLTSAPKPVPVAATAKGCDETRLDDPVAWGRSDLTIVLRPLAALTLRVVDASGAPVTSSWRPLPYACQPRALQRAM
ncbi:MAG TPA: sigma-70 family RNA polymerase sigma factor [Planctomycetota bacterium]|nr:sigma-70 family RNA polymerase sigma factor [Planctomycetota bacterium]